VPTSKHTSVVPTRSASTNIFANAETIFVSAIAPKKSQHRSDGCQSGAFAQAPTCALLAPSAPADCDLLAPLHNRVTRNTGEPDGGQHQAKHSNSGISCIENRKADRLRLR
jgi:hypothetical protein